MPPQHWVADLTQGFRVAWAEPRVRPLLLMTATNGLFGGGFAALYLLFALRTLHLSPAMLGITVAFGGLGALMGAGLAAPSPSGWAPAPPSSSRPWPRPAAPC
uniref:Uncharacterized protein n=1 Tax=Phenylobacterium glaciei TaxID=2803784 RepID=A0A974S7A5_9CAUL|nr:hypothetical protein JKL49_22125 [Phenylobacterium glaciei]